MYTVRRDVYGHPDGIDLDGKILLHLVAGSNANIAHAESVVEKLNLLDCVIEIMSGVCDAAKR